MSGQEEPKTTRKRRARLGPGERSRMVGVRVTDAEYAFLVKQAEAHQTTVPGMLLAAATTEAVEASQQVLARKELALELMDLKRSVAGAYTNLNQVAKKANTVHEIPANFAAAVAETQRIGAMIEAVVGQLVELNRRATA